jgi:hypothetical protein
MPIMLMGPEDGTSSFLTMRVAARRRASMRLARFSD